MNENNRFARSATIMLPPWIYSSHTNITFNDLNDAMRYTINLAKENIRHESGGPFAAIVVDSELNLVSIGVNLVCSSDISSMHAEIVALTLAQQRFGTWDLSGKQLTLITSCEPCAMCCGALPWSGIAKVVCGATTNDAESIGFDEGDKLSDWIGSLERRNITVLTKICQSEANDIFVKYQSNDGLIYGSKETNT